MRILLTGANGYIGSRLLPVLAEQGHQIVAMVRSAKRLAIAPHIHSQVSVIEADLTEPLPDLPRDIDAAYYLVHSMGSQASGFLSQESRSAVNFRKALEKTECKQIIYLSGLATGTEFSEHMASRHNVERLLSECSIPVTTFRASIIIGSGSASFEIIRDLVEKLPVMIAPRWLKSKCQPIAINDVLFYLTKALHHQQCYNTTLEIGGPEQITYRGLLLRFAKVRKLHRWIIPVPVLTPRLSSYWLFFVTATSFPLAQALVNSLKVDAICTNRDVDTVLPHTCLGYEEALQRAFSRIEQNSVISSWKAPMVLSRLRPNLEEYVSVPTHGCLSEQVRMRYKNRESSLKRLWRIGGASGWYTMNWAWKIRGLFDRMLGGIGIRRGRTDPHNLSSGDVVDFWRVLLANRDEGHLLLYAEMRIPGEAWLEFRIERGEVVQTSTYRPRGVWGRLYWYSLVPVHYFLFRRLCRSIAEGDPPCNG